MQAKQLGILGGTGPMASAFFHQQVLRRCSRRLNSHEDADYPRIIHISSPVPGLTSQGLLSPAKAFQALVKDAQHLEALGCEVIALPCNSLHALHSQLAASTSVKVLDMVGAVCDRVVEAGLSTVSVLSSQSTRKMGLYVQQLAVRGINAQGLDNADQAIVDKLISLAMAGDITSAGRSRLAQLIDELHVAGSQGVILGCTELPLLEVEQHEVVHLPVFDSTAILADAVVQELSAK